MGIEIERKFLIYPEMLDGLLKDGVHMVQSYLTYEPAVRIRVERPTNGGAPLSLLTIKLKGKNNLSRPEFNYEIPVDDGLILSAEVKDDPIDKTRYRIGRWEIDHFHKSLSGLWLAEIELEAETEYVAFPPWIRREVTEDVRYSNANLIRFGIPFDYAT
jgi:adenylate cyclase